MKNNSQQTRYSWLWLALSTVLLIFSNGRWMFPLASWLAFPLLLRFTRLQKPLIGYLLAVSAIAISSCVAWYGVVPFLPIWVLVIPQTIFAIFIALAYLADRLAAKRVGDVLSTLIFPAAMTVIGYVLSFAPGNGTWGALAYTQYGILPLMQLVSITGIYGLVFLICWFASVVNFCWENGFVPAKIRKVAGVYMCVLLAVLVYGGIRLLVISPDDSLVRVAAVKTPSDIPSRGTSWRISGISPFHLQESLAILESQTAKAADAGAKIIAWQEYADLISDQDKDAYIQRGQKIAAEKKIYLLLGPAILDSRKKVKGENTSILIDPAGTIKWTYLKSHLVEVVEKPYFQPGNKKIPRHDTPYGTMASVICFDFSFPAYVRSAGRGISLMIVPSFDWKEITPLHAHMAVFRGIENGFSVLRPTGNGLSIAADACGRVIASQNSFTSKDTVMLTDLSVKSVFTVYSVIGDALVWVCLAGLIVLIMVAVRRRFSCPQQRA